jgi:hypothetical protein
LLSFVEDVFSRHSWNPKAGLQPPLSNLCHQKEHHSLHPGSTMPALVVAFGAFHHRSMVVFSLVAEADLQKKLRCCWSSIADQ